MNSLASSEKTRKIISPHISSRKNTFCEFSDKFSCAIKLEKGKNTVEGSSGLVAPLEVAKEVGLVDLFFRSCPPRNQSQRDARLCNINHINK